MIFTWILGIILLTILFHYLTIAFCPYFIMIVSAIKNKRKPNRIYHAPPTNADSRDVVRPSPDLLYSGCPFNISKQPLRITAEVPPDTYFSISAFAANTDNFFVINDRQINSKKVDIVLTSKNRSYQKQDDEIVVNAPSNTGVVFIRTLVKNPSELDQLIFLQHQAKCCLVG